MSPFIGASSSRSHLDLPVAFLSLSCTFLPDPPCTMPSCHFLLCAYLLTSSLGMPPVLHLLPPPTSLMPSLPCPSLPLAFSSSLLLCHMFFVPSPSSPGTLFMPMPCKLLLGATSSAACLLFSPLPCLFSQILGPASITPSSCLFSVHFTSSCDTLLQIVSFSCAILPTSPLPKHASFMLLYHTDIRYTCRAIIILRLINSGFISCGIAPAHFILACHKVPSFAVLAPHSAAFPSTAPLPHYATSWSFSLNIIHWVHRCTGFSFALDSYKRLWS